MKTRYSIFAILLGVLLVLGSCVPLGYGIWRSVIMEPAQSIAVVPAGAHQVEFAPLVPERPARLSLHGRVTTSSVQEEKPEMGSAEPGYTARYRFPLNLNVQGEGGGSLWSTESVLAWDAGSRSISEESVSSTGGSLEVRWPQETFNVPASGRILVQVDLGADDTYGAQLSEVELEVFDNLPDTSWYFIAWVAALIAGLLSALAGLVLIVSGAGAAPVGAGAPARPIRERAIWCHLSGFAGYLFPFAGLIAPLVLWLAWRDEDPFILEQGREAVNFQISVHVYVLLCVLLMFVLVGFVLIFALAIFDILMPIIAAVRVSSGESFRYPMIFRLVRP